MALTRPTLLAMAAFDATKEQIFSFVVTGTSAQIVANQLIIRNNDTNDIVYQENDSKILCKNLVDKDCNLYILL